MLAVVVATGCGFDVVPAGVHIDAARDAPIDAPVDTLIDDLDDDDDGIVDVSDNCPRTANADQHDEDVDTKGDRCDPCPQLADADTDTDGDTIGDACDPHPAAAGDVLVLFDGFGVDLALPTGWTQVGGFNGDWDVSADALRLDTQDTPHLLQFNAGAAHTTIDLLVDVSGPGANVPTFSAIVDGDAALTTFFACSVLYVEQARRLQTFSGGVFTTSSSSSGTVAVPGTHRVVATSDANNLACSFGAAGQLSGSLASSSRGYVGIRARNLRAAFHYIAVYRSP